MMRTLSLAIRATIVAFLLAPTLASAQSAHAAFTGTWILDTQRSTGSGLPDGLSMRLAVDARRVSVDQQLDVNGTSQAADHFVALIDSASDAVISTPTGNLQRTVWARWAGDTLVITTVTNAQGSSLEQDDRWTVSPDGKTLNISSHMAAEGRAVDRSLVWERR